MTNKPSVEGTDQLKIKLGALGNALSGANLGKVLLAGAFTLEGIVKISLAAEKHGRQYGNHVASAPGEAPAVDFGALMNSVQSELENNETAVVGTNMEYALPLELGTAHIEPRPFMRPAADEHKDEINNAAAMTAKRLIDEAANA